MLFSVIYLFSESGRIGRLKNLYFFFLAELGIRNIVIVIYRHCRIEMVGN